MMIDAHVHLLPQEGFADHLTGEQVGAFGRLLGSDGQSFQYMPPFVKHTVFDWETLAATLDHYRVGRAVIQAHIEEGVNDRALRAQQACPGRLFAAMAVDPFHDPVERVSALHRQGLNILKFEMRSINETLGELYPDSAQLCRIYEAISGEKMTVVIDPGPCGSGYYRPRSIADIARAYPRLHFVICHLGLPRFGMEAGGVEEMRWRQMMDNLRLENVWTDTSALPDLFAEEEYPYPSAMERLRWVAQTYGTQKLIWGSDIPGTLRNATYSQMISAFTRLDFLSEADRRLLFEGNAVRAYRLPG